MQYVNDDMDELFRRAAEDYPLDTRSGDWSKVMSELQGAEAVVEKKDRRRRFLWLLLLAPFTLICNSSLNRGNHHTSELTNSPGQKELNTGTISSSSSPITRPVGQGAGGEKQTAKPDASSITSQAGHRVDNASSRLDQKTSATHRASAFSARTDARKMSSIRLASVSGRINGDITLPGTIERSEMEVIRRNPPGFPVPKLFAPPVLDMATVIGGKVEDPTVFPKRQKFYAALMGGADLTTIKFQKVEHAGYDYGLLLGYELGKHWAVEAGIFMDKKSYYSEGRYFNTAKMYIPPNSKIVEVSGNCHMIELPVSARYNFHSSKPSSWFVTGGLSSYLMKKEDYGYVYYYGGSGTTATHYKEYNNASRNLFSVAQVSGGYNHSIGKLGAIRIEPYLKLPLSGMGTGKVPLLSSGIHVGLTRKLF